MIRRRQALTMLLALCDQPAQAKQFDDALYAYAGYYSQDFFDRLRSYYHDDASALKWIEFFEIDLKQLKIDIAGRCYSAKTVKDVLTAQQQYLFPLLERMDASCV